MKSFVNFCFYTGAGIGILLGLSGCFGVTETGGVSTGITSGEIVYSVPSGYAGLVTLCYALPETATDTVSENSSFQITAGKRFSSRAAGSLSGDEAAVRVAAAAADDERGHRFHAALRETERLLSEEPPIASRGNALRAVAETAPATVGDSRSFYVSVNETFKNVIAECVAVTGETAFWSESGGAALTEEQLNYLTTQFESKIPTVREKFGREADIDGNGQIFVLMTALDEGIFGYFYSVDKHSQSELDSRYPDSGFLSNEADIFYVNNRFFGEKFEETKIDIAATLVHEMQHMVHFDQRNQSLRGTVEAWLNEGLSMLCEYYCGYAGPHAGYVAEAFRSAGISLIESPDTAAHYGYALLFLCYLQERFGDSVVTGIYKSPYRGVDAVAESTGTDFNELYADFCTMILQTGRGVTADSRYEIPAFNYRDGTDGYAENGFRLASIVDAEAEKVDLRFYNRLTVKSMKTYAFVPVRWVNGTVASFTFSSFGASLLIGAYPE